MNILFNIAVSLIASAVIFVGGMNLPASNFSLSWLKTPLLGAFTEITTATNLADFPTTYNANLNKTIEVGTTSIPTITTLAGLTSASSLATIGTIVSGIWNGTVIGVAYNGTGTTSPTSNQVILGNGSSGFKVVSGFGNSGQFLTSGGAATAPTWTTSVIDNSLNYNWTGTNLFKNLNASSTVANPLVLNGISYSFPSTVAASSTILTTDGTSAVAWTSAYNAKLFNSVAAVSEAQTASTTVLSVSIPANTFGTSNAVRCEFSGLGTGGVSALYIQSAATVWTSWSYGGTSTTTIASTQSSGSAQGANPVVMYLVANGATNSQKMNLDSYRGAFSFSGTGTFTTDNTSAQTLYVVAKASGASSFFAPDMIVCTTIR